MCGASLRNSGRETGAGYLPHQSSPKCRSLPGAIYLAVTLLCAGYTLRWTNFIVALAVGVVVWLYFEGKARAEERWLMERYPDY